MPACSATGLPPASTPSTPPGPEARDRPTVELVALDWLRELLGLPEGTEGVTTSGGSLANLTALAAARAADGPGVCYLSDQTHASITRGLAALGFAPTRCACSPPTSEMRLPMAALRRGDRRGPGGGPASGFVVANAGTTNTGAVDPLADIAELARRERLWLHVDGAYGASAALCESRPPRPGRASSSPTRWCSTRTNGSFSRTTSPACWSRRPGVLKGAFHMVPDYLADVTAVDEGEVDFRDRSLELTRRPRALKLWLSFRVYGVDRMGRPWLAASLWPSIAERLIARRPGLAGRDPGAARHRHLRQARRRPRRAPRDACRDRRRRLRAPHQTTVSAGRPRCDCVPSIRAPPTRDVASTLERLGVLR